MGSIPHIMTSRWPNIFEFTSSEVSQDAFVAWLLKWANPDNESRDALIYSIAVNFVKALLEPYVVHEITSVEVKKKWNEIDIVAIVNDAYFIVIEDKKSTEEPQEHLKRYAELTEEYCYHNQLKPVLVCFKMEEEDCCSKVQESQYRLFKRDEMITVLESVDAFITTKHVNQILLDYYFYLKRIESQINDYNNIALTEKDNWHSYAWKGFFSKLQESSENSISDWDHVPNQYGGLMCYRWYWKYENKDGMRFDYYLQLEQDKLCFKLHSHEAQNRGILSNTFICYLYQVAKERKIKLTKLWRSGAHMSVAKLDGDYRISDESGKLDMSKTIVNLKRFEELMDAVEIQMHRE